MQQITWVSQGLPETRELTIHAAVRLQCQSVNSAASHFGPWREQLICCSFLAGSVQFGSVLHTAPQQTWPGERRWQSHLGQTRISKSLRASSSVPNFTAQTRKAYVANSRQINYLYLSVTHLYSGVPFWISSRNWLNFLWLKMIFLSELAVFILSVWPDLSWPLGSASLCPQISGFI